MKILIVGQHYDPDNLKVNDISFELAAMGHSVTKLTWLPDYSTGKVPKDYKFSRKRKETIREVSVVRVPADKRDLNYDKYFSVGDE